MVAYSEQSRLRMMATPLKAIWSTWRPGDPCTSNTLFAEYNTYESGVSRATRLTFTTLSPGASYSILSAVGNDYTSWVDLAYLV